MVINILDLVRHTAATLSTVPILLPAISVAGPHERMSAAEAGISDASAPSAAASPAARLAHRSPDHPG